MNAQTDFLAAFHRGMDGSRASARRWTDAEKAAIDAAIDQLAGRGTAFTADDVWRLAIDVPVTKGPASPHGRRPHGPHPAHRALHDRPPRRTARPFAAPAGLGADPMNGHTCGACLYFDPWINTREAGVCHRYPPSIPNAEPEDDNEPDLSPVVRHDSWCGEFKPERPSKPRPRRRA